MSSLCGVLGEEATPRNIMERMLASMAGLQPVSEHLARVGFTVSTTQPGLAGDIERIATSEDGAVTVAFAGYLYTEDLQARSRPAQHCLDAYERVGLSFPLELNGTFAVVIYDGRTRTLHLISDRLCTRALYYCRQPDAFLFASEVKAILEYPGVSRKLNEERLLEFLTIEMVLGCDTYYDHIRQVPPASVLTWDGHEIRISEYWRPVFRYDENADIDESAERIAAAITGAMKRVCAGVDRAALMLSGGLDSRTIAAASPIPLHCMTMHSEDYMPDVRSARRVASMLRLRHEFIRLPETYPLELLSEGSLLGDGMYPFHHAQGLYLRHALAQSGPQVLLNGYAVDLYFQGGEMPRAAATLWSRLTGPPHLIPAERVDPVAGLLQHAASDSASSIGVVGRRAEEAGRVLASRANDIAAGLASMALGPHDLTELLVIRNAAKCYAHLHLRAMARLTGEGLPAWDNEIIDVWLLTPPPSAVQVPRLPPGHCAHRSTHGADPQPRCAALPQRMARALPPGPALRRGRAAAQALLAHVPPGPARSPGGWLAGLWWGHGGGCAVAGDAASSRSGVTPRGPRRPLRRRSGRPGGALHRPGQIARPPDLCLADA